MNEQTEQQSTANGLGGLIDTLNKMISDQHEAEVIGGSSIASVLEHIMLDVAFTPVIAHQHMNEFECPPVSEVIKCGNGSYIVRSPRGDENVPEESLKVMRARFLLWRGHFADMIDKDMLPYSAKNEVIAKLFGGHYFSFGRKP